jgi:sulfotransferase
VKIHFISGLPRSGSTMLASILRQNPRFFHFGMSSPVCDILMAVERATSRNNPMTLMLDEQVKRRLRKDIFHAIYWDKNHDVIFDTNRFWCAKLPLLTTLYPDAKVICCVRHVSWIMDSFERLYRAHPLELSALYDFAADSTVFTRCAKLASSAGVVGRALDALREGYYGEHADRLHLIDYDILAADPQRAIRRLYEVIGEPLFLHNFESIESPPANAEFDRAIGSPGLHDVRPKVELARRKTILPPMLFERFANDDFWSQVTWREDAEQKVKVADGL